MLHAFCLSSSALHFVIFLHPLLSHSFKPLFLGRLNYLGLFRVLDSDAIPKPFPDPIPEHNFRKNQCLTLTTPVPNSFPYIISNDYLSFIPVYDFLSCTFSK
ncbi:hypothetical protein F5878DRAFT_606640 [Lentinula raphanica]|uniref:Uncharacterized protein n=1 Tax=Lentinula raphanica TaxID=153919 RepID=A0AA38PHW7_9AGAR|nr:hypothetical protein F5878DRAFT_606640 [Lentinula raphanica]